MAIKPGLTEKTPEDEDGWWSLDPAERRRIQDRIHTLYPLKMADPDDIRAGYDPDPAEVRRTLAETAGSWADLDADQLIEEVYEARGAGSRPIDRP